ncbi:mitogen-activated protein kinase kinase kinase 18-like [Euphorbia lathyris]|uniref:mitogen-activated protein kinase kinase kinase 18-like n=1 Tax=Euphorbia lathyris TaxID=212925 RepID=UPI0033133F8D
MEWKRGPVIGSGSTATVSLATFTSTGELFAVKSSQLSNSLSLQKEEFFLSKFRSPYLVEYVGHEITQENGDLIYNICLEYAPAGTLSDVIYRNGGWLDESTIRSYTTSIILGLDYLHSKGLVHCDIKGENILITKEGAKITDFGYSRFVEEVPVFCGTPAFVSPEVARGEEQGSPADVWALGCTIIEMATGNIPWSEYSDDDPISALLLKIGFTNSMPEFPIWLSEKGKDFLSKCLTRDPRERWTTKELLYHPFVVDDKEIGMNSSPRCVLDHDLWDSVDGLQSSPNQDFEVEEHLSNRKSPAERMNSLIGSSFNWDEEWSSEEEDTEESALYNTTSSNSILHKLAVRSSENEEEEDIESALFIASSEEFELAHHFSENENRISPKKFSIWDFVSDKFSFLRLLVMKFSHF